MWGLVYIFWPIFSLICKNRVESYNTLSSAVIFCKFMILDHLHGSPTHQTPSQPASAGKVSPVNQMDITLKAKCGIHIHLPGREDKQRVLIYFSLLGSHLLLCAILCQALQGIKERKSQIFPSKVFRVEGE
jgi:hypothetical protein